MTGRFSLRTLMLTVLGFAMLCALFTCGGVPRLVGHTALVLAFAIPGGSFGFDIGRSSRSVVVGVCVASVAGTLVLGASVLVADWWLVLR